MTPSTPFLKSLIHNGLDGQLSLIGFPWDLGLLRSEGKTLATGLDNGPDSFRRFLDKIGPIENAEYGISLTSLSISDYGNIRLEGSVTLEGLLDKLRAKCLSVLKKKGLPVTVGGSSDCVYGPLSAILEHKNKGEKVLFIRVSNRLDCKNMFDGDKICAESSLRKIVKEKSEFLEKNELKILYFSVDQSGVSFEDETFLKEYKDSIDLVHIKNIRKTQPEMVEDLLCPITQAGVVFQKLLQEKRKEFDYIYLSIKLEALNVIYFYSSL